MKNIKLPNPNFEIDLKQALMSRRTRRKIEKNELPIEVISNILWVCCGETKKATKRSKNKRTIPSACNAQKVSVLAVMGNGVYRYDEPTHSLIQLLDHDIRDKLVNQKMLKGLPFGLIYIAKNNMKSGVIKYDEKMQGLLIGCEVGAMSQNVSLYSSGIDLNTVVVGLFNRDKLIELLPLNMNEEPVFTHVFG